MSGVRTSSLSLPSSLRNWVILDYEEANGLTIRPWAPVFSHILSSYPPSPSSRSRSATPSVPLHGPCRRRWGKEWCGRNCRSYHLQSHHIAGFSGSLLSPPYSRLSPLASLGPWFTARHARSVAHLSTFASRPHPFAFLIPFTYHLFSHSVGQRPVPPERNGMGRGEWNAKGMGMLGLVQLGLLSFFPRSRRLTAQHSHSPHSLTSLVSWGTVGHYVPFRSFPVPLVIRVPSHLTACRSTSHSLHLSLHQVLQLQPCNTLNLLSLSLVTSSLRLSVVHSHVHSLHPYAPQAEERSDDWE